MGRLQAPLRPLGSARASANGLVESISLNFHLMTLIGHREGHTMTSMQYCLAAPDQNQCAASVSSYEIVYYA